VPEGRLERWSPLAGIVFVVLFLVGSILMDTSPDPGASDATITDFYEDDGNQLVLECASLVLVAAGVFFVWFVGDLAGRVRASRGGSDLLSRVVVISGAVFTALVLVGFMLLVFVEDAVDDNPDVFAVDVDTARLLLNGAYTISYETALPLVAPLVVAVSIAALRGFLPRWFVGLGWSWQSAVCLGSSE
jgi:preprotein translocase subunit SecG